MYNVYYLSIEKSKGGQREIQSELYHFYRLHASIAEKRSRERERPIHKHQPKCKVLAKEEEEEGETEEKYFLEGCYLLINSASVTSNFIKGGIFYPEQEEIGA